ncbi:glycosyltransferase [Tolypothrix sp. PCC 7712]|nr:glycosyltransferase [Tolypothrix sp. PCC 7712]
MLTQALESLRWQSYKDFVVMICDDASTANLQEVVNKFPDLNIEYLRYDMNVGQFANAMRGVERCQTQFIKFLYSDDLLFPNALEKQVKALEDSPNTAVCLGEYIEFKEENNDISLYNIISPYIPELRTRKQWARLEEYAGFIPSACMYRTEFFRNIGGFHTALPGIGDWEIFVALSYKYSVVAIDEPVCAMRLHSDQVTKKCGVDSDAIYIKDVLWMTSNSNHYRERLGLPLSQQFFLRLDQCWVSLRSIVSAQNKFALLKKWLGIFSSNKMLIPFILAFPWFVVLKILRKPKLKTDGDDALNKEEYENYICSIVFDNSSVILSK